jgi:calcium/calmodulin-dependent protein kinase I
MITTEVCEGGELFEVIYERGSLFEKDVVGIIRTVSDAASYLHSQNIVHRDLKTENLIYKSKTSKLEDVMVTDFGLSKIMDQSAFESLRTTCGTPVINPSLLIILFLIQLKKGFMAPEILLHSNYGKSVDVWVSV